MQDQYHKETCKCCAGLGVQILISSEKINCKVCNGKGWRWVSVFEELPPGTYSTETPKASDTFCKTGEGV